MFDLQKISFFSEFLKLLSLKGTGMERDCLVLQIYVNDPIRSADLCPSPDSTGQGKLRNT